MGSGAKMATSPELEAKPPSLQVEHSRGCREEVLSFLFLTLLVKSFQRSFLPFLSQWLQNYSCEPSSLKCALWNSSFRVPQELFGNAESQASLGIRTCI